MKKYHFNYLIAFVTAVFFTAGCQQLLPEDELPEFVRRIVVNGVLSNDSTISMEISASGNPYKTDIRPEILSDAQLILQINDVTVPISFNATSQRYESASSVNAGDKVHISVSHDNILSAVATVYMPPNLATYHTKLVPNGGTDINGLSSDRLDVVIQDDKAARNYYNLRFFYYDELATEYIPFDFPVRDQSMLAASTFKLDDGTYIIKDDLFNGKLKTVSVVAPLGLVAGNTDIKYLVQVISLSEDYWLYLETLSRSGSNSDSRLFNNGVVVQSNIAGGLGILATQLVESDTIR